MDRAYMLAIGPKMPYLDAMAKRSTATIARSPLEAAAADAYDLWKDAKIERALKQAEDREALIPAETVWRDLGLER
jgi:hypothetical protein